MKRFLFLSAVLLTISLTSCNGTWICECGNSTNGFEVMGTYDNEKEAQSDCYTTEVNLQSDDPTINCLVIEAK